MIKGVEIKKLKIIPDDRGYLVEVVRSDDKLLKKFGQTTFTLSYSGVIKAFHYHQKQDDVWFIARGNVQVVLHDLRKNSATYQETQVIYAGETNPVVIKIPRGVAHGYRVLGNESAIVFYHMTETYNPNDEFRIPFDDPEIGFDWKTKPRWGI